MAVKWKRPYTASLSETKKKLFCAAMKTTGHKSGKLWGFPMLCYAWDMGRQLPSGALLVSYLSAN